MFYPTSPRSVEHDVKPGKRGIYRLLQLLDRLIPPGRGVVLHSYPDLDDNVVALLRSSSRPQQVVVLVDHASRASRRAQALEVEAKLVRRCSASGLWRYFRSRVSVSTHGLFGSLPRGHGKSHASPWHGELGKVVGAAAHEPTPHFDRFYVSSRTSLEFAISQMELSRSAVRVTGVPRQDSLEQQPLTGRLPEAERHLLWVPTYRATSFGLGRHDADPEPFERCFTDSLRSLSPYLTRERATLWVRPHPMMELEIPEGSSARIKVATDEELEGLGLTLYEFMSVVDLLITDYSSIWIDFLLVGRPIVGMMPDQESYLQRRPMCLQPYTDWFPGPIACTPESLVAAVESELGGSSFVERRTHLQKIVHATSGLRAERVWADIAT